MDQIECIEIIGVPSDLGQGRRGVDMGPSAIRYAQLEQAIRALGIECIDRGDIDVTMAERSDVGKQNLRHIDSVIKNCSRVKEQVMETLKGNKFPLILGGDHSISIGTLAALCELWENPGVIWVDAHADFNTHETTPSGNIHGMSLAVGAGLGAPELLALFKENEFIDPSRMAIIGLRDIDSGERDLLWDSGVAVFTMHDIDRRGLRRVLDDAIRQVSTSTDGVHVSFDMDVINPESAPGVGTPVNGGLNYREAHLAMEIFAESEIMRSLEVVEVNPILDERNRTAKLAVELIASALGKKIF